MPETTTEPTALAVPDTEAVREALAELDDYTRCVCTFEPPAGGGHYASCNADLRPAVEVLRAALAAAPAGPDDAHTETFVVRGRVTNVGDDTTSTLRHTEWLTIGTDEDGNEGAETFEAQLDAVAAATRWRIRGMTNVYVERHDVSTTRTVTLWEAQR